MSNLPADLVAELVGWLTGTNHQPTRGLCELVGHAANEIKRLNEIYRKEREAHAANLKQQQRCEAEIKQLRAELKALDPDPVVCGCREAGCPHTPIAKLPRQALVDYYKAEIRALRAQANSLPDSIKEALNSGDGSYRP